MARHKTIAETENRDHLVCVTHIKKLEHKIQGTRILKKILNLENEKDPRLHLKISGCSLCVNYENEFGSEKAD